ncbi:hypothetical protein V565_170740, partial [Rhizoctonia solani 123E]
MPRKDCFDEVAIIELRKAHLIGTFTVFLSQTQNHPDQRALDQAWVDVLVEKIGTPGVLNRAAYPISVILEDSTWEEDLTDLLDKSGIHSTPDLPNGVKVLVFAGQHRVAMLAQLGLGSPDQLWWHANVYKRSLETEHPAEFLTMMHETNSPQVVKTSSDVDLFRAVVKLKGLLKAGTITEKAFVQNRTMLLSGSEERTRRAICNLTRNESLMDAISKAVTRVHIANVFSPGSWMRLTTGRLYMVATGLVKEMTKQVDQLTQGMSEVPGEVMLRPQSCLVSKIANHPSTGKKSGHAWDVLPGGRQAALKRACRRPSDFVTPLNPKKEDPWSLPDVVLLPSCFGSRMVEDELKQMQKVTNHILRMVATNEQFELYNKGNPDTLEDATDHPEGMLAKFLQERHSNDPNLHRYEHKRVWVNRARLDEDLGKQNIPGVESAGEEDYQRLVDKSKVWWDIMRLFKVSRLRSHFRISVSKEFGSSGNVDTTGALDQETTVETSVGQRSKRATDTHIDGRHKRARTSASQSSRTSGPSVGEGAGESTAEQSPIAGTPDRMSTTGDQTPTAGNTGVPPRSPGPSNNHQELGVEEEDLYQSDEADLDVPVEARRGGDRRLAKVLEHVSGAAEHMTRSESRVVIELLDQILESRRHGSMLHLVKGLVSKEDINEDRET